MAKFFATRHTPSEVQLVVGPEANLTDYLAGDEQEDLIEEAQKLLDDAGIDYENVMENTLGIADDDEVGASEALVAEGWAKGRVDESATDDDDEDDDLDDDDDDDDEIDSDDD